MLLRADEISDNQIARMSSVFAEALLADDIRVLVGETYLTIESDVPGAWFPLLVRYNLTPFCVIGAKETGRGKFIFVTDFRMKPGPKVVKFNHDPYEPPRFNAGRGDGCFLLILQKVDIAKLIPLQHYPISQNGVPLDKTPLSEAIASLPHEEQNFFQSVYKFAGQDSIVRLQMDPIFQPLMQPIPRMRPGPGMKPLSFEQKERSERVFYSAPKELGDDVIKIGEVLMKFTKDTSTEEKLFNVASLLDSLSSNEGRVILQKILEHPKLKANTQMPEDTSRRNHRVRE